MSGDERGIEELHAEWTSEVGPLRQLTQDIWRLHHRRKMFNELVEMLEGQGNPHRAYVDEFLAELYLDAQLVLLRRLIDTDSRSVSFRRLINQLIQHRTKFTREWYVGLWTKEAAANSDELGERLDARVWGEEGNEEFDKWIDDKPGRQDVLGGQPLQQLLDALIREIDEVKRYVDQHVAHVQVEPDPVGLTYGHVDRAIERAGETLQSLSLFLEQVSILGLEPTVQGDWKSPFRAALIDCNDEPIPWDDPCWTYKDGTWRKRSERTDRES
jgi:hypothetical protein